MRSQRLAALAIVVGCAGVGWAGIASTGSAVAVRPPTLAERGGNNDLNENEFEATSGTDTNSSGSSLSQDSYIRIWFERNVTVGTAFSIEHLVTNNTTTTFNSTGSISSGTIASGTKLSSYYLHWDPVTASTAIADSGGSLSITFDEQIIGIAVTANPGAGGTPAGLDDTDAGGAEANGNAFQGPLISGTTYMTYSNHATRGFALGTATNQDRYQISGDRKTITILNVYDNNNHTGDLRILTAQAIPEPATLALFGAGAVGMIAFLRGRRRRGSAVKTAV